MGVRNASNAEYSYNAIARAIRTIYTGLDKLSRYLEVAERPVIKLFYEDFAGGDLRPVQRACDMFGVPKREASLSGARRAVERLGDSVNVSWALRFRREADDEVAKLIEEHADKFIHS
jgi:LPS sulfotransferase NodH